MPTNGKIEIDNVDKKILTFLMKNARMTFLEIAKACGISSAAIHQRVKKLEDAGIIDGSKYVVNPITLGYDICVFTGVHLDKSHVYKSVIEELKKVPEIVECHFTTGQYTLFLKIFCKNKEHLMEVLINTLQNIPGIARTETFTSLEHIVDRQVALK